MWSDDVSEGCSPEVTSTVAYPKDAYAYAIAGASPSDTQDTVTYLKAAHPTLHHRRPLPPLPTPYHHLTPPPQLLVPLAILLRLKTPHQQQLLLRRTDDKHRQ